MKKKLNPFNLSLHGHKIIEASAGTGKTLTLIIIYLRLLLGINHTSYNKRVFSVQEILVVTFTKSTRSELYKRIKENIHNLRIDCIKQYSHNPIFKKILCQITNFNDAIILLLKAENNLSQAAIYTIHGFCHNILHENILYSDFLKKNIIIENTYSLYLQATCDFWNKQFYLFPNEIGAIISKYWTGPEHFLNNILPLLTLSDNLIKSNLDKKINILQYHQSLINIINTFKKKWLNVKDKLLLLIKNTNINKRIYHDNNLLKWINIITLWAIQPTKNYFIPRILDYFKYTVLKKQINNSCILNNNFFKSVDNFLNTRFSLKEIFLSYAIINIPLLIKKAKKNTSQIEFNDLLIFLYRALKKNHYFTQFICKKYPIALIDEFQDTDLYQYKIFKQIYNNNNLLILIGDPKQSIYSFRGANIFAYFHAKYEIKEQYYLDTNWRASYNMTKSINYIFSKLKKPFLLSSIDFLPVHSPIQNKNMTFEIDNIVQPALRFLITKEKKICINEYHTWISQECAKYISYWLNKGKQGHAIIKKGNHIYSVKPCDIVVLVRNKIEANIIKKSLDHINIQSCYLSEKNNIYHTKEAYELLLILKAILEPRKEKYLRQAMFTNILSYNSIEIDSLHENIEYWSSIIEQFKKYSIIWKQSGILKMINKIIKYDDYKNNKYNIINLLYLSELLQKKSRYINNYHLLIFWFENKIYDIKDHSKKNYITPSINKNCIKIVTIYKSKGLEYNIVWIPFAINFSKSTFNLYHNKKNSRTVIDFNINEKNLSKSKIEHLSEEMRLLYVALTRSTLHCSIGIAPIFKKNSKNNHTTDLHNSALGYIIQSGKKYDTVQLERELQNISKHHSIELEYNSIESYSLKKINKINKTKLYSKIIMNRSIIDNWEITSYSALKKIQKIPLKNHISINITAITNKKTLNNISYTPHNFPKGTIYGTLLHTILKKHDFNKQIDLIWLNKKLKKYQLNDIWLTTIAQWIKNIIYTPLLNEVFTLSQLNSKTNIKELEFYIPIEKNIYDYKINKIIQYYDNISKRCPNLSFNSMHGMLTGSIDLVFFWKNKYYIVDYKSTWLGDSSCCYTETKIQEAMIKNRYDIQYQLYAIALHRYLKQRIKKYKFSLHFGGIFYLFLRALDGSKKKNGLFYTLPKYALVKKLDKIFSIKNI
ncbi:MAG TPA: exodeoxyribonuclease V subunit beta [Buchnera sp. (in: enterobacteria)]|nr:exodeoxyribonuclease V subunit beta [Buchnera sp. (in: enterobacteria)]